MPRLNASALLGVFMVALAAMKAMAVVHFDPNETLALVAGAGPVQVLVGSLVWALPQCAPTATLFFVATVDVRRRALGARWSELDRRTLQEYLCVLAALLVVNAVSAPFYLALFVGFMCLIYGRTGQSQYLVSKYRNRDSLLPLNRRGAYDRNLLGFAALTFLYVILSSGVWIPPENVEIHQGSRHLRMTAFVFGNSDGWFTLLMYTNRHVIQIPANDVVTREICDAGTSAGDTLYELVESRNYKQVRAASCWATKADG
jgi:hypothetical protein